MTRRHSHGFWLALLALVATATFALGHLVGASQEWQSCRSTPTATLGIRG